ncbi:hypothetical protein TNCV_2570331 [Trichonephila clavipes]|nr:hypothetical protein TNCV_2570331 [Trichonephila clavipes]
MPPSRLKKPTFVMPHIKVLSRHGIEDCFTVQIPKGKRLFNAYSLALLPWIATGERCVHVESGKACFPPFSP